jgi:two-component system, sensor histidine kinase and response regulator
MDGLAATRALRQQPAHAHRPIIAMSANVGEADRAETLAAGMDDHVGKPFDLDALVRCLQRWTGWLDDEDRDDAQAAPAGIDPAIVAMAQAADIDLSRSLERVLNRTDVWSRMARQFAEGVPGLTERLRQLWVNADTAALARELHSLKGLAGMLGAQALASAAARAEQQVEGPNPAAPLAVLSTLAPTADALAGLALRLQAPDMHPLQGMEWPPQDPRPLRALLVSLQAHLDDHDMAATELHQQLSELSPGLPVELAAPLAQAMARLDFAAARRALAAVVAALDGRAVPADAALEPQS